MYTLTLKSLITVLVLFFLTGCASVSPPAFDTSGVDPALTPQTATASPQAATGHSVQWGGTILGVTNLQNRTRIEVLSYPLSSKAKPRLDYNSTGRFYLERPGFLDPATYAKGRLISTVGTVTGTVTGTVGEASYEHPVVNARQIYLWPEDQGYQGSGMSFGVGVGAGSWGGGSGWGVGVGTGF